MKKRVCGIIFASLLAVTVLLPAPAAASRIYQGYVVDGVLADDGDDSGIIQGHVVDGVLADGEDGGTGAEEEAATCLITFHPNGLGAVVAPASKRVVVGRAFGELPLPVWDGCVFLGWRTAQGDWITANTLVSLTEDTVLYAQWSRAVCRVLFDASGGDTSVSFKEVEQGGNYGILPTPFRNGFSFDGWYTARTGGTLVDSQTRVEQDADHTLYAHWTELYPEDSLYYHSETAHTDDADACGILAFRDVPESSNYYNAVCWALRQGVTSGTSPETFSPNSPCKKKYILTFLWRANGCPEPRRYTGNSEESIWGKGILWAYEKNLIPDYVFNIEEGSTRSEAVTYLWKLAGSPAADASLGTVLRQFTDVSGSSDYAQAVAWALKMGITNGTTSTTFSPDRVCTRGQIVTFLYRCYGN